MNGICGFLLAVVIVFFELCIGINNKSNRQDGQTVIDDMLSGKQFLTNICCYD